MRAGLPAGDPAWNRPGPPRIAHRRQRVHRPRWRPHRRGRRAGSIATIDGSTGRAIGREPIPEGPSSPVRSETDPLGAFRASVGARVACALDRLPGGEPIVAIRRGSGPVPGPIPGSRPSARAGPGSGPPDGSDGARRGRRRPGRRGRCWRSRARPHPIPTPWPGSDRAVCLADPLEAAGRMSRARRRFRPGRRSSTRHLERETDQDRPARPFAPSSSGPPSDPLA